MLAAERTAETWAQWWRSVLGVVVRVERIKKK